MTLNTDLRRLTPKALLHPAISSWRSFSRLFCTFGVAVLLLAATATAQLSGKGEIKGVITDSTGAVVPGATVVAVSNSRGTKVSRVSTSAGDYDLSPLDHYGDGARLQEDDSG